MATSEEGEVRRKAWKELGEKLFKKRYPAHNASDMDIFVDGLMCGIDYASAIFNGYIQKVTEEQANATETDKKPGEDNAAR